MGNSRGLQIGKCGGACAHTHTHSNPEQLSHTHRHRNAAPGSTLGGLSKAEKNDALVRSQQAPRSWCGRTVIVKLTQVSISSRTKAHCQRCGSLEYDVGKGQLLLQPTGQTRSNGRLAHTCITQSKHGSSPTGKWKEGMARTLSRT